MRTERALTLALLAILACGGSGTGGPADGGADGGDASADASGGDGSADGGDALADVVADAPGDSGGLCCVVASGNGLNVHCAAGEKVACLPPYYEPPEAGLPPGYSSYNAAQCYGVGTMCTAWPGSYGPCVDTSCCMGTVMACP